MCWAMSPTGMSSVLPRAVGAPGIVPLHVGLFGWDVEPTLRELAYAASVGLQDGLEVRRSIGRLLDQRRGVAGLEEVDALIVGEEYLAGVEASGRGKSATPRSSRIVREVGSVPGVAHDHEVPSGVAGRPSKNQHLLELA